MIVIIALGLISSLILLIVVHTLDNLDVIDSYYEEILPKAEIFLIFFSGLFLVESITYWMGLNHDYFIVVEVFVFLLVPIFIIYKLIFELKLRKFSENYSDLITIISFLLSFLTFSLVVDIYLRSTQNYHYQHLYLLRGSLVLAVFIVVSSILAYNYKRSLKILIFPVKLTPLLKHIAIVSFLVELRAIFSLLELYIAELVSFAAIILLVSISMIYYFFEFKKTGAFS